MKYLYRMAWHDSPYAEHSKGEISDTYMDDVKPTIAEAVAGYVESTGEDPLSIAINPGDYLIYTISVADDWNADDDGILNGTIEDILPLEKAYPEGIAE